MMSKTIQIPLWQQKVTSFHLKYPKVFYHLGKIETAIYQDQLKNIQINKPIFITGLARCGSSILLNLLHEHPECASFTYKHYPFLHTPIWWTTFLKKAKKSKGMTKVERIHQDGLLVNSNSPESFDEPFWKLFFPNLHSQKQTDILNQTNNNKPFNTFYQSTIQKILQQDQKTRFLCKNNYHFSRLEYLINLFNDAKIIVLIREPGAHIASLMKQHTLISRIHQKNAAFKQQFKYLCHYEFGYYRKAIVLKNKTEYQKITKFWNTKKDFEGWLHYWHMIYSYLEPIVLQYPKNICLINYDDLCQRPSISLKKIYRHVKLPINESLISKQCKQLHSPQYYCPFFSKNQQKNLKELTSNLYKRYLNFLKKDLK